MQIPPNPWKSASSGKQSRGHKPFGKDHRRSLLSTPFSYFLRFIGSKSTGEFHLSIRVKMPSRPQPVSPSDPNAFTKQTINIGATPRNEKQVSFEKNLLDMRCLRSCSASFIQPIELTLVLPKNNRYLSYPLYSKSVFEECTRVRSLVVSPHPIVLACQ